ncbi:MAG TPA: hypothetical protein VG944_02110 [Fimbriimonas sp.]|nr:hypothetical protein [Fimbriimonas sp.]
MAGINDPYSDPPVVIEHKTINPVVERNTTLVETEDRSWGPWAITFILGVVALVAVFAYFMIDQSASNSASAPAVVEHSTTKVLHDDGGRAQPIIVTPSAPAPPPVVHVSPPNVNVTPPASNPTINVTPPASNPTINVNPPSNTPDPDNNSSNDNQGNSNPDNNSGDQ